MNALETLYPETVRGADLFGLDRALQRLLAARAPSVPARHGERLTEFGTWVARDVDAQAAYTDRHAPPVLEPYDAAGRLVNRIRHNPLWEAASRAAYERGVVGLNYGPEREPFSLTFAMGYLLSQADVSLHCPVTMTGAVAYVLDRYAPAAVARAHLGALTRMDGQAVTGGTWATEHHGGSDVGATTTRAVGEGASVRLYGLKWFTSNANGGLALATARPEGAAPGSAGLGLYLVPTHLADGSLNPLRLRRLKEKLGTKGVPTGEIDLDGTLAIEVASPPRGFRLMMEALGFSRIHNAVGAAGVVRRALLEAAGYALRREAFGHRITHYPMVQDELLKLLVAHEASLHLAFEAVFAFEAADGREPEDEGPERVWLRLATALAKYFTAEEAVRAARGALELIGGNGYTADYATHRLVRDAQVLTVWEGPANIQALEVLRLLGNRMAGGTLFRNRVAALIEGGPAPLAPLAGALRRALGSAEEAMAYVAGDPEAGQRHARRLLALLADLLAGALLLEAAGRGLAAGDWRGAHVLELFIEDRLEPLPRRGILSGRDWTSSAFEALMGHDCVPARLSATPHPVQA